MKPIIRVCGLAAISILTVAVPASAQLIDLRSKTKVPLSTPRAAPPESIVFTEVLTNIELGALGDPRYVGDIQTPDSAQAVVKLMATTGVQLTISGGADFKENRSGHQLPTRLDIRVQGLATLRSVAGLETIIDSPNHISDAYFSSAANDTTTITFQSHSGDPSQPASYQQAIAARAQVERNGLRDATGTYSAQWVLSWFKF